MTEPFYVSTSRVDKVAGVHRRAHLEAGAVIDVGVHGQIKEHYRIEADDMPLPVDYLVAAAAT